MNDCIFCKIIAGEVPSKIVFQNEDLIAIEDINPQAPVHLLFISRKHIPSFAALSEADEALLTALPKAVQCVAAELDLESYRMITNVGVDAGQTVGHLHWHLLAGTVLDE